MHPKDIWNDKIDIFMTKEYKKSNNYININKECKNYEDLDLCKYKTNEIINPWTGEIEKRRTLEDEVEEELAELKEFLSSEEYEKAFLEELKYRREQTSNVMFKRVCGYI